MKVDVKAKDKYLYQKIKLILGEESFCEEGGMTVPDVILTDGDLPKDYTGRVILMSRSGEGELKIPFSEEELMNVLYEKKTESRPLTIGNKCVILHGEKIALTELEHSLLCALSEGGGEFISREELLHKVWGKDAREGILNVYIHYLREKLEVGGEKIIISSRKQGYKISERYAGKC